MMFICQLCPTDSVIHSVKHMNAFLHEYEKSINKKVFLEFWGSSEKVHSSNAYLIT